MAKGIAIPAALKFIEKSWNERPGAPPMKEEAPKPKVEAKPA